MHACISGIPQSFIGTTTRVDPVNNQAQTEAYWRCSFNY